jgi:hypothetical protein
VTPRALVARVAAAALLLGGAHRAHAQAHDHAHMDMGAMTMPMEHHGHAGMRARLR